LRKVFYEKLGIRSANYVTTLSEKEVKKMKGNRFTTLLVLLGLALVGCSSAASEPVVEVMRTESPSMVEEPQEPAMPEISEQEGEAVVVTEVVEVVVTPPPIAIQPLPEEPRPAPTSSPG
jgi:hypothetical protein